jgi:DNA invertase Pin-like site-specific DNA recombinase
MKPVRNLRCAIYTRVSTDQSLDQEFNSLDAQREASEAYIKSQAHEGWRCRPEHFDDGGFSGGTMERPALQRLLETIRARKVDVIVVYKVDRLTRSLADFAKLVELFDQHSVSFVSVTQHFNTTSSMGRLTLNVLLSFAQFEREVTGERIRDKIAASKKKGMWMGGIVPFGYRVEDRKLLIDKTEAEIVRLIFARYREIGSLPLLIKELASKGIKTRARKLTSGRTVGGIILTTGPLHHMLSNRVYLGEINHKGQSYRGEHEGIVNADLFDAVQENLRAQRSGKARAYERSDSLLIRLIFDDRGNRMSPVFAKKGPARYRYYQSWVIAQGRKHEAGSVPRVPAEDIEQAVITAIRTWLTQKGHSDAAVDDIKILIRTHVAKVVVRSAQLDIALQSVDRSLLPADGAEFADSQVILTIPWSRPSAIRHREILRSEATLGSNRPIRSEARSRLLAGIARGRRWLDQIRDGIIPDWVAIAAREDLSEKTVRSVLSLAFLAPDIVQAVIDGRLPRGFGISQLTDLPMAWDAQRQQLGLASVGVYRDVGRPPPESVL